MSKKTISYPPEFVKNLISFIEKNNLNENYVEFDFIMGTVLMIFSFFQTDNDIVCSPLPPKLYPPTLAIPHL